MGDMTNGGEPTLASLSEDERSELLGIPMDGADPRHCHFGTMSGARSLFAAAGVPQPLGEENIASGAGAAQALRRMRAARPGLEEALLKLNDGFGGKGKRSDRPPRPPRSRAPAEARALQERLGAMSLDGEAIEPDVPCGAQAARERRGGAHRRLRLGGGVVRAGYSHDDSVLM